MEEGVRFCEDCPLRWDCTGDIQSGSSLDLINRDTSIIRLPLWIPIKRKEELIHMIELHDSDGGESAVMGGVDETTVYERIAECSGVYETPTKGRFGRVKLQKHCGALLIRPNVSIEYASIFRNPFFGHDKSNFTFDEDGLTYEN